MTDLRAVARSCLEAALEAVDPVRLVLAALEHEKLQPPVTMVAVGKAAGGMAVGAGSALAGSIESGLLVTTRDAMLADVPEPIEILRAGHPLPDEGSAEAGKRIEAIAKSFDGGGTFLLLLSGGASALMTLPAGGIGLSDLEITTRRLLESGAAIDELNAVRKHLDALKGGRMAKLLGRGRKLGLVLSDVVGDRLDVIASGPLVPDSTSFRDAVSVLRDRGVWNAVPEAVREHLERGCRGLEDESPGADDPAFEESECRVVGGNRTAQAAAKCEAERLGFEVVAIDKPLTGEARDAGRFLAAESSSHRLEAATRARPMCLVAGGETTVTVRGSGTGGRNQELALAAALEIEGRDGILVAAVGTDGRDGPTDAAGAMVDGETVGRARAKGYDAADALASNDAYPCLEAAGDLIVMGPTGTNAADLSLVLMEGS